MHIIGADAGNGVRLITVHIDQALEAIFLTAVKQPVDGALLVNFAVVGVEIVQEVVADDLFRLPLAAQCVCNKAQIILQRAITVYHPHKLHKAAHHVIFKVFVVTDGNNTVCIRLIDIVFAIIPCTACVGKAIIGGRVAAKHTAHSVGDKGAHIPAKVRFAHSHIFIFHFWGQFVLQAVNINKNAVQFFLVGFQLLKAFFTFASPNVIALSKVNVANIHHVGVFGNGLDKGVAGKVPRGFKGIPISF